MQLLPRGLQTWRSSVQLRTSATPTATTAPHTNSNATAWTTARRLVVSSLMLATFLLNPLSSVQAYTLDAYPWPDGKDNFYVCIKQGDVWGFPSSTRQNKILAWMQTWEYVSGVYIGFWRIGLNDNDCSNVANYDIVVSRADIGPASTTDINPGTPWTRVGANILIHDGAYQAGNFYWGEGPQDCVIGLTGPNGCDMDMKTIIIHEAGHALGLNHNSSKNQRCYGGGRPEEMLDFCWSWGETMMHWNAGAEFQELNSTYHPHQGYRHHLTYDDEAGLRAAFDWQ